MVAIGWAVAEIEEVDGGGGALIRSPEERYTGGLPQCRQDNNDIYSCPNHASESVRSPVDGL